METARELWKAAGDDLRVSDPILGSDEFVKRVLAHVEDERADQGQEPGRITFNVAGSTGTVLRSSRSQREIAPAQHRGPWTWVAPEGARGGRRLLLGAFNACRRLSVRCASGAAAPEVTPSPGGAARVHGPCSERPRA